MWARAPTRHAGATAAALLMLSLPTGATIPLGADLAHDPLARELGWTPDAGQIWIGAWNAKTGWNTLDEALAYARANGILPVVEWYYWGDAISRACIERGCGQRTVEAWDRLGVEMATHIEQAMDGSRAIVVVETEFNKNGIETWERFDGILAAHLAKLRQAAPRVEFYIGFGAWGLNHHERFDRAAAAADGVGFQMMRATTRNEEESYHAVPARIEALTRHLAHTFKKPVILHDLALSSYGEMDEAQASVIAELLARRQRFEAAGLSLIVYRSLVDEPNFPLDNHFGPAERHWGLIDANRTPKPAWTAWIAGAPKTAP